MAVSHTARIARTRAVLLLAALLALAGAGSAAARPLTLDDVARFVHTTPHNTMMAAAR